MTPAQRHILAGLMDMLVDHTAAVHYAEIRPMRTASIESIIGLQHQLATQHGITMDCSESVTLMLRLAGCHDPNGLDYDGAGNTQTMLEHLPHYSEPAHADVGALCVFSPDQPLSRQHVCMVRRHGNDPVLFTHGQESDPAYRTLSWMLPGFQGYTFLNVSRL